MSRAEFEELKANMERMKANETIPEVIAHIDLMIERAEEEVETEHSFKRCE